VQRLRVSGQDFRRDADVLPTAAGTHLAQHQPTVRVVDRLTPGTSRLTFTEVNGDDGRGRGVPA
jgi:hypothetical protein